MTIQFDRTRLKSLSEDDWQIIAAFFAIPRTSVRPTDIPGLDKVDTLALMSCLEVDGVGYMDLLIHHDECQYITRRRVQNGFPPTVVCTGCGSLKLQNQLLYDVELVITGELPRFDAV